MTTGIKCLQKGVGGEPTEGDFSVLRFVMLRSIACLRSNIPSAQVECQTRIYLDELHAADHRKTRVSDISSQMLALLPEGALVTDEIRVSLSALVAKSLPKDLSHAPVSAEWVQELRTDPEVKRASHRFYTAMWIGQRWKCLRMFEEDVAPSQLISLEEVAELLLKYVNKYTGIAKVEIDSKGGDPRIPLEKLYLISSF